MPPSPAPRHLFTTRPSGPQAHTLLWPGLLPAMLQGSTPGLCLFLLAFLLTSTPHSKVHLPPDQVGLREAWCQGPKPKLACAPGSGRACPQTFPLSLCSLSAALGCLGCQHHPAMGSPRGTRWKKKGLWSHSLRDTWQHVGQPGPSENKSHTRWESQESSSLARK